MSIRIRFAIITIGLVTMLLGVLGGREYVVNARPLAALGSDEVVIEVDATSSNCTTKAIITQGTTQYQTVESPCLPGTTMKTEVVSRQVAEASHQPYVVQLPSDATAAQRNTFQHDVATLVAREHARIRGNAQVTPLARLSTQLRAMSPTYTCGWTVDSYQRSFLGSDTVDTHVRYYLQSNCSQIIIDEDDTTLASAYLSNLFWKDSRYNSWPSWFPEKWINVTNYSFTSTINSQQNAGGSLYLGYCDHDCSAFNDEPIWTVTYDNLR